MDEVRSPPPVWAIAALALAVAAAAGFVLYFQLGSVGLDGLAVATGGVVASLLVALYYRQTAILAEQTELQRRQTELLERLHDRDGAGTDGQPRRDAPDPADSPARPADQDGSVDVSPPRVADATGTAGSTTRADGSADAAPREGADPEPSVADRDDPARDDGAPSPSQRR